MGGSEGECPTLHGQRAGKRERRGDKSSCELVLEHPDCAAAEAKSNRVKLH